MSGRGKRSDASSGRRRRASLKAPQRDGMQPRRSRELSLRQEALHAKPPEIVYERHRALIRDVLSRCYELTSARMLESF